MRADVLLENFSPGTMDRHGVGSVTLCELNPRLIYAAGTGFGRTGPDRDYLAMDITVQAMSGIMAITGDGEGPPLKAGAALCDFLGGIHLYGGIVTALFQRERTGAGCVVDVAIGACGLQPVGGASACGRGFSPDPCSRSLRQGSGLKPLPRRVADFLGLSATEVAGLRDAQVI